MAFMILTGFAILAVADEFEDNDLSDQETAEGIEGYNATSEDDTGTEELETSDDNDTTPDRIPHHPRGHHPRMHFDLPAMMEYLDNWTGNEENFNLTEFMEMLENWTHPCDHFNHSEFRDEMDNRTFEGNRTLPEGEERDGAHPPRRRGRMRHHHRGERETAPEAEA